MDGVILSLEPGALHLLKDDACDCLELSRLLKSISSATNKIKNGPRLENVTWRRINRRLVANRTAQMEQEEPRDDSLNDSEQHRRKGIFFFNNTSSPDTRSNSPADNQNSILRKAEHDFCKGDNVAQTLLKRNGSSLSKVNHITGSTPASSSNSHVSHNLHQNNIHSHSHNNNNNNNSHTHTHNHTIVHNNTHPHNPVHGPLHVHHQANATKSLFSNNHVVKRQISQSPLVKVQAPPSSSNAQSMNSAKAASSESKKLATNTTSLFSKVDLKSDKPKAKPTKEFDSSDEGDSEWMDSDWSSISDTDDDDDDDDDDDEERIRFEKKVENNHTPHLKRSLLSGLFIDKMNKQPDDSKIKGNTNPKLVLSPISTASKPSKTSSSISPLIETTSPNLPSATKTSRFGKSISPILSATSPNLPKPYALSPMPTLTEEHKSHSSHQTRPMHNPNIISHHIQPPVVNKSTISLTSFYASNRRPTTSNAPATASTLLPTALSTHMFLPTKGNKQNYQHGNINTHNNISNHGDYYKQSHLVNSNADSNTAVMELTRANLAKLTKNGTNDVAKTEIFPTESLCSVKTSTSSIDIPGKQSMMRREREMEKIKERERQQQLKHRPLDPNRDIKLEVLEKELPLNLVDSIHNENRLFGMGKSRRMSTIVNDNSETSNIIASGILGNRDLTSISRIESLSQTHPVEQSYVDDHLIDSYKVHAHGDSDDDNNYHAKGW